MGIFFTKSQPVKVPIQSDAIKKEIERWEQDANSEIINTGSSMKSLQDEYDRWIQLTYKQRKVSNQISNDLFGISNIEHFEKLKHNLMAEAGRILYNPDNTKIDLPYSQADVEAALRWSIDSMNFIITPQDNIDDLEKLWRHFNTMTPKRRRDSDAKSIEIFDMDNTKHYDLIKGILLRNGEEEPKTDAIIDQVPHDAISTSTTKDILSHPEVNSKKNSEYHALDYLSIDINDVEPTTESAYSIDITDTNPTLSRDVYDLLPDDLPYFTPDNMIDFGIIPHDVVEDGISDPEYSNQIIDTDKGVTISEWFKNYYLMYNGFITEDSHDIHMSWRKAVGETYYKYESACISQDTEKIAEYGDALLKLGWNKYIDWSSRSLNTDYICRVADIKKQISNKNTSYFIDMTTVPDTLLMEATANNDLHPIYIVLSYSFTNFGKVITKVTKATYSHAAFALDSSLTRLYSFNSDKNKLYNGFSIESKDKYSNQTPNAFMAVYALFVKKEDLMKIKIKLDDFIARKSHMHYSILNCFTLVANKPIQLQHHMICSQFVDYILKSANINITNKASSLVTPGDFEHVENKKIYKIYQGKATDYNQSATNKIVKHLSRSAKYINETSTLYDYCISRVSNPAPILITETKEFPVKFDKDGNLFISRIKRLDYEQEYSDSHKLLMQYEDTDNIDGIKYELSKLWAMNCMLEKTIHNRKTDTIVRSDLTKVRARVLNDFKRYLKLVLTNDKTFNFTEYYNSSPFSDATIKIDKNTIKYSGDLLAAAAKKLLSI